MKKRLWIPIIFLIVVLCVPVMAEDESVWNFDAGNYTIDGYSGAGGDVIVPDTLQGRPVEIIGTGDDSVTGMLHWIQHLLFLFKSEVNHV